MNDSCASARNRAIVVQELERAGLLVHPEPGTVPFTGADEEEIHEQARKLALQPPARLVPGLHGEASELVMAALGRQRGRAARIGDWRAGFAAWARKGIVHSVEAGERTRLVQEASVRERDAARRFRTRTFWEKNWKVVAISAAGVAVAGAVLGSILGGVFAPRLTRGYPPRKVVESFYTAINAMDHALMEDCLVDRAGKGEINEAMNLYVLSRVQYGYEGKSNTIPADEWDRTGRPALASGTAVYGVTDLEITEEAGEPAPVYRVSYEKWSPDTGDDSDGSGDLGETTLSTLRRRIVDRVSLRSDKGDWVIFRLDRVSDETLPSDVMAAPAAASPQAPPAP